MSMGMYSKCQQKDTTPSCFSRFITMFAHLCQYGWGILFYRVLPILYKKWHSWTVDDWLHKTLQVIQSHFFLFLSLFCVLVLISSRHISVGGLSPYHRFSFPVLVGCSADTFEFFPGETFTSQLYKSGPSCPDVLLYQQFSLFLFLYLFWRSVIL